MKYILVFVILALFGAISAVAEDFLGCGGFVQVDKGIGLDLSKVEVRLYTKQGSLKYQTDCAPNNGYYFIPIYDKGDYVIKVVSPNGWSFEPSSRALSIDKETDECSLGKDINFKFQGFSIHGKVLSHGRNVGPAGVEVQLFSGDSAAALQTVTTEDKGHFAFKKVAPGDYRIKASHAEWKLGASELSVKLVSDSHNIEEGLEIVGYPVRGHVSSEGEPIQNVIFSLYSHDSNGASFCGLSAPSVAPPAEETAGWSLICQTISDLKGQFSFPVVPPGHYKLIPLYQGENIRFDINPASVEFHVEDNSLNMPKKFEVQGFRVSGRVLEKPGGSGLVGARVILNDKQVAFTGEGGAFNLENIKTGMYRLTAESDQIGFERLNVRISPTTPSLPDIVASSYKVCGKIELNDLPIGSSARQVIFIPLDSSSPSAEPVIVSTDDSGKFCQYLQSGKYKLEPMAFESEVSAGLKLLPASYAFKVEHKPVGGFIFRQFRTTIQGQVKFLGSNSKVAVRLTSASKPTRLAQPQDVVTSSDGTFEFTQLLPGKYQVSVVQDDWCWKSKSLDVEIDDRELTGLSFEQIGFFLPVSSSHDVEVSYSIDRQPSEKLTIKAGTSKHCLPQAGRYVFTPQSCHVFESASVEWSTDKPSAVHFKSVRHRMGVVVKADHEIKDLRVSATSSGKTDDLPLSRVDRRTDGQYEHKFVFDAATGETLQIVASADALLFFPSTLSLTVGKECDERAGTILAQKGLYVSGTIRPAIPDVSIAIQGGHLTEPVTVATDSEGRYTYGPVNLDGHPILDLAATFQLAAEKKGYIIRPADTFGDFIAEKLAEINVLVVDHSGQPLPSVLVAAAGGVGYRQNSQTGSDGKITLSSLNPGDYFIKPVLKEYKFEPSSKLVHIDDGATVEIQIKGERVAFSCYGTVTSLNGDPEASVSVEAVGTGSTECEQYQEDATTESNGQFRIRGLIPGCEYIVRMKTGNGYSKVFERTLPPSKTIKMEASDVTDVRFIGIKPITRADVMVTVEALEQEHLKYLRLALYREDQPNVAIQSIKMDNTPLVILPNLPLDGKRYILQIESTLSRHSYDYRTQEASFVADRLVQHVKLEFHARRKTLESAETTQVSVRSFFLLVLCLAGAYYYQLLGPLASRLTEALSSLLQPSRAGYRGRGFNSNSSSPSHSSKPVFSEQELALMSESSSSAAKRKVKPRRAQ